MMGSSGFVWSSDQGAPEGMVTSRHRGPTASADTAGAAPASSRRCCSRLGPPAPRRLEEHERNGPDRGRAPQERERHLCEERLDGEEEKRGEKYAADEDRRDGSMCGCVRRSQRRTRAAMSGALRSHSATGGWRRLRRFRATPSQRAGVARTMGTNAFTKASSLLGCCAVTSSRSTTTWLAHMGAVSTFPPAAPRAASG